MTISTFFPTFVTPGHGPSLIGEDTRQPEQDAGAHERAGVGRPSTPILSEVPRTSIACPARNKEWTAEKDSAESHSEYSRVDFVITDGPCMNGKCDHFLEKIILIFGLSVA